MPNRSGFGIMLVLALIGMCRLAPAGPVDDYGIDFATIGAPGNAGIYPENIPYLHGRGAVDYEYRLSRTEITVGQWFEFVQAYAPHFQADQEFLNSFIGLYIGLRPTGSLNDPDTYILYPENANLPTMMSWRMAARYCNWLHNGKATNQAAFESGAYDTSTFTSNPDGSFNDQLAHSASAKYWIPTFDEWIKGMHYDPALNDGAGGWWPHPNSSNEPLVAGVPGEGETNASLGWGGPSGDFYDVGSYPDQQSPWGLLDGSGGMREWTEETFGSDGSSRYFKGSGFLSEDYSFQWEDTITTTLSRSALITHYEGLRIASTIPAPGALALFMMSPWLVGRARRRRREEGSHAHRGIRMLNMERTASTRAHRMVLCALALLAAGLMGRSAMAGPIDDYGIDFATIGAPGNVGYQGGPGGQFEGWGTVDYEYRLSRTEITTSQWFEFVQAYAPYYDASQDFIHSFIGGYVSFTPTGSFNDPDTYYVKPEHENLPTTMSWRMAARYCNWLHNGKATDQEAFESGAYDTSTFVPDGEGGVSDQRTRSSGAKYWIPSFEEWMKGVHYDPALNDGAGGWWDFPNSSNAVPTPGIPGEGETNATLALGGPSGDFYEVGSYPDQQSPWGLLDGSGGMREWTETGFEHYSFTRWVAGSSYLSETFHQHDEDYIADFMTGNVTVTTYEGLRIASAIPSPGGIVLVLAGFISTRERKHT